MHEENNVDIEKSGISLDDVIGTINSIKGFLENNPGVVNAVDHVVKNGIKHGGYDIVKVAIDGAFSNGNELDAFNAALAGLNENFEGTGSLGSDLKSLGKNSINRYKQTKNSTQPNNKISYDNYIVKAEYKDDFVDENTNNLQNVGADPLAEQNNTNQEINVMRLDGFSPFDIGTLGTGSIGTVVKVAKSVPNMAQKLPGALEKTNQIVEASTVQVDKLGENLGNLKNSGNKLLDSMRRKPVAQNVAQYTDDAIQYVDDVAELANTGFTEAAVQGATSTLQKSLSSAAKGGVAGAVIGITMETVVSYKKYKNGEITGKEYATEIVKSGGQFGTSGAVTAGITTAITPALTAVAGALGVACPVVAIPVSIAIGLGIDKIIAPAFGRGDYKKILDDCKYYQNLAYAHDDLVRAIAMSENQLIDFIDQYQQQAVIHEQLSETNRQINQLHGVANKKLQQQSQQLTTTMGSLNELLNKI